MRHRARVGSEPDSDPLPKELVRFRSFGSPLRNGDDEPEVLDHLKGRLRFKDITTFNDPFEAKPHHVAAFQDAAQQREAMIRYLAQIAPGGQSLTARRKWAEKAIAGKGQQEIVDSLGEKIFNRNESGNYMVFCLMSSTVVKIPLPWSHYADSHRGVCLHFDTTKLPIKLSFPVEYSDEYPTLMIPRTAQTDWTGVKNVLLRKSRLWDYEKEFRVTRIDFADGISRTLLCMWEGDICLAEAKVCKAITFGARMPEDIRARLTEWIGTNTPHVRMWKAELHHSRYRVLRTRVT